MAAWLRSTTWVQRAALLFLLATTFYWVVAFARGESASTGLVLLFALIAAFTFRNELLWRVRNRLLLTFFLFGVVPILLIALMGVLTVQLALGQIAGQRVRQGLAAQALLAQAAARHLAASADALPRNIDRASAVVRRGDELTIWPASAPIKTLPPADFVGIIEQDGKYYLGAADGPAFVYVPLDAETIRSQSGGVVALGVIVKKEDEIGIKFGPSGTMVSMGPKDNRYEVKASDPVPSQGFWDLPVAGVLRQRLAETDEDVSLLLFGRVSSLSSGLTDGPITSFVLWGLLFIGLFFLVVEIISLISSVRLTRTITKSVDALYKGTQQVAAGDFSHRIPVRGKHQLSELSAAFNNMSAKIEHYLGEMRKKEKLESEVEIARQVQGRLFPRMTPDLRTLKMAGLCIPGRFISGDYYDYFKLDDRHTAIALGDVSGKGVSAALLMASIQSALHTQLLFSGTDQNPTLSTATLMALVSQYLYESTPPEKYATFFFSIYDDETGVLKYTNCGHLRPMLVRAGKLESLPGDGMVIGLFPKVGFDQHHFQMLPGDLITIFSDGVSDSENAVGKEFGEDRLADVLALNADKPLEEIIQAVVAALKTWMYDPEAQDDTTLVVMRQVAKPALQPDLNTPADVLQ